MTGEKLGQCEKTELDGHFEELINRAEQINRWNEKIAELAEMLANSSSSNVTSQSKLEEFFIEKLATKVQEKRTERLSNLEWFGHNLLATGQDLTFGDTYGSALIDSGQTELIVGQIEREFAIKIEQQFTKPLKFLSAESARALSVSRTCCLLKYCFKALSNFIIIIIQFFFQERKTNFRDQKARSGCN